MSSINNIIMGKEERRFLPNLKKLRSPRLNLDEK